MNVDYPSWLLVTSADWTPPTLTSRHSDPTWTSAAWITFWTIVSLCRSCLCGSTNWTSKPVFYKLIRIGRHVSYLVDTTLMSLRLFPRNRDSTFSASSHLTGASSTFIVFSSSRRLPSLHTITALLTTRATVPFCKW